VDRHGSWARAGRLRPFASEHWADLLEADGGGDERPGIDDTARVRRNGGVGTRGGRQNANRSDVLENQGAGVNVALASGQADIDDPSGRFHPVEGQRRQVCGVGSIDHRVEGLAMEAVPVPDVLEPEAPGEYQRLLGDAHQVDLGASRAGEHGGKKPDSSRAEYQRPVARR
jgi:hypothetical protein